MRVFRPACSCSYNHSFIAFRQPLHLVAPGQGHMVIHRGCIPRLAAQFIEEGSLDALDSSCVDDIEPQAFFTSFAGPPP